jgi:hypothetical protein
MAILSLTPDRRVAPLLAMTWTEGFRMGPIKTVFYEKGRFGAVAASPSIRPALIPIH